MPHGKHDCSGKHDHAKLLGLDNAKSKWGSDRPRCRQLFLGSTIGKEGRQEVVEGKLL